MEGAIDLSDNVGCASGDVLVGNVVCMNGELENQQKNRLNAHPRLAKKSTVPLLNPGRPFAVAGSSKYVTLVN